MRIITMIGLAAALCASAAVSAQRGEAGGTVGAPRVDQRMDAGRTAATARNPDAVRGGDLRGGSVRDEVLTGTRLQPIRPRVERPERGERDRSTARRRWNAANPKEPSHSTARRRWNAANPGETAHNPARRRWNAANPPAPTPSRSRGSR
ncbi:MAG: hypothetical protein KF780_11570 [Sphingomonas sp.]|nr:hypothetical protein [Sphingomonas sp.]